MPDVTTSEIQNRITGLKAELDRLSLQLETSQRAGSATDSCSVPTVSAMQPEGDAVGPDERERSLRTLRDLMWQGRWGLAFHLARALEAQGAVKSDFPSSTIRMWALAQDGRRHEAESLRLAHELLQASGSAVSPELASRLLEWAIRIGVASGMDASQVGMLSDRFLPPDQLPATCEWWRDYVETLRDARSDAGKWVRLPDPQRATGEIEELMLRGELEPIRLAASCLMMSIRRAMRHVHALSVADERYILNVELARATNVRFAENGEVASDAREVERAVCEIAQSPPRDQAVVMTDVTAPAAEHRHQMTPSDAARPERALESAAGQPARRATARERLEGYAQRVAVPVVEPRDQPVVVTKEQELAATSSAEISGPAAVLPIAEQSDRGQASPGATPSALNDPVRDQSSPLATPRNEESRRIHEAALANAFSPDAPTATARQGEAASPWGMTLFNPQAAIVAGLLVIAGAVIVGLGTGLAARDLTEVTATADDDLETPSEFAGDLPAVD